MQRLLSEHYEITKTVGKETARVLVEISMDDEVTVRTDKNNPQFVFTRSSKDLVKAMGEALQEAAELVDARKTKAA